MDVSRALHEGLWLEYRDEDYFQAIYYEQIPFRCRKCHEHGHLVRECPLNKTAEDHKEDKAENNKQIFTKPKAKQRAHRKHKTKASTLQGNTGNAFEILETERESEDNSKEQKTIEINKATTRHETKKLEGNPLSIMLQIQETIEGAYEDSEILISDIGSEDMELNDILEQEGMNLLDMVENWKKKRMEHISEEEVKRINDILIARQRVEMEMQSKSLGIAKGL